MPVIDTNTRCIPKNANDDTGKYAIGTLLLRGVTGVGRYYSVANPDFAITQPEAQALSLAQIKIFTIYEDTGHFLPLTEAQGRTDGKNAHDQATAIRQPLHTPIYFTLEGLHLPLSYTAADLPGIRDYFKGVKEIVGGDYQLGVYSDGLVCKAMLDEGICTYTWLSASTSFTGTADFYRSERWNMTQMTPTDQDWSGVSVDVNAVRADGNYGNFFVPIT